MGWMTTTDVAEFSAAAGGMLRARPASNTVLLTVVETLRERGTAGYGEVAPLFGWWCDADGAVGAAFLHTPPYPVALTTAPPPALTALADELAGRRLPGVAGHGGTAERFAAAWRQRTGAGHEVHRRQRLYRLAELTPPAPAPPGGPRVAGPADRDLLISWYEAFERDIGEDDIKDAAAQVDDRLSYGGLTLWEVDGAPVALAGTTRQAAGMVRVGPVYTPGSLRRRGYGGAATAAASSAARRAGVNEVLLFTDLANPTSNALYQRLGYRPVEDQMWLSFTA